MSRTHRLRRWWAASWLPWWPGLRAQRPPLGEWLGHDLLAGLALTAVLVPVGIAYAVASGLPGISGLYATIVALLAYALFGPSRLLVLGPDSSLTALVLAVVLAQSAGDPQRALALAGAMALVAGLLCVLAGVLGLGFITDLLSKPIRYGYMNGIALTVLVSQLPGLLGLPPQGSELPRQLWGLGESLWNGRWHGPTALLGLGALGLILLLRGQRRLPGVLLAVVGATVVCAWLDLDGSAGVKVLGRLPQGLPAFSFPLIHYQDLVPVLFGGLAIALVAFADTSVLSRTYAARTGDLVDSNQEMLALGAANLAAGLFQGLAVSASSSRTPVAEAAGARSPLAGVVGALGVAGLLLFGPDLLQHLPRAALAAVVIASALLLFELGELRRIHRMQPWECWLSLGCTAGVALLGAVPGIGLAILVAVGEFLWAGWRPHHAVLGRADGVKGYHDTSRYPQARQVPGLLLFRWDAPLFFANAELFQQRLLAAVAAAPGPLQRVVVAAEPVTNVDVTAADMLVELDRRLQAQGIRLCFAELKDPVKDKLRRFGLLPQLFDPSRFFATLGEAVSHYLQDHPVGWVDWEDRLAADQSGPAAAGPDAAGAGRARKPTAAP